MTVADWPAVARIYQAGIDAGDATFEHAVPPWEQWSSARERCGFTFVGLHRRVGKMQDGRWRDVALYERRSPTVGVG